MQIYIEAVRSIKTSGPIHTLSCLELQASTELYKKYRCGFPKPTFPGTKQKTGRPFGGQRQKLPRCPGMLERSLCQSSAAGEMNFRLGTAVWGLSFSLKKITLGMARHCRAGIGPENAFAPDNAALLFLLNMASYSAKLLVSEKMVACRFLHAGIVMLAV